MNSTPLLDAAIERVAAVTREQRDSVELGSAPSSAGGDAPKPAIGPRSTVVAPTSPPLKGLEKLRPADNSDSSMPFKPMPVAHGDLPFHTPPVAPTNPSVEIPRSVATPQPKPKLETAAASAAPAMDKTDAGELATPAKPAAPPRGTTHAEIEPLGIGKLRLCRNVLGFGSVAPLGETEIKAGQRMLVYCEMTGMHTELKNASFVSRLSSKIEIRSTKDGTVRWAHEYGPAEDVCGSRRRDFYVNYRVDLPETMPPGPYCLRLTQTDLIASRSTSAELPLEITPRD